MKLKYKIMIASLALPIVFFLTLSFKTDLFQISKNIEIFISIYKQINERYVDDVSPAEIMKKGIDAMLNSLDPYTEYYAESEMADYKVKYVDDSYGGIGASSIIRDGKSLVLIDIFANSPAQKVDLHIGDEILSIDGIKVTEKNVYEIGDRLKGGRATEFSIVVKRGDKELVKHIKRDKIVLPSVHYSGMVMGEFAYVRLDRFIENSADEVLEALKKMEDKHPKGIILDLRNNGGGLLSEAVKLVNLFVPANKLVVTQKGRLEGYHYTHRTVDKTYDTKTPLIVLINEYSASASEIVTGALQDLDRAVVIGKKSFGKALVQQTIPMPYNSLLKITVAKYYTPSGRCLQSIDYFNKNADGSFKNLGTQLSQPYLTEKGREIYNSDGVFPDIQIKAPEGNRVLSALLSDLVVFDYCNKFRNENEQIKSIGEFKLSDATFNDFVQFVLNKKDLELNPSVDATLKKLKTYLEKDKLMGVVNSEYESMIKKIESTQKSQLIENKKEIVRCLESELIHRYYFEKGQIEYDLLHDSYIAKSAEVLRDKQLLNNILTGVGEYKTIGKVK